MEGIEYIENKEDFIKKRNKFKGQKCNLIIFANDKEGLPTDIENLRVKIEQEISKKFPLKKNLKLDIAPTVGKVYRDIDISNCEKHKSDISSLSTGLCYDKLDELQEV